MLHTETAVKFLQKADTLLHPSPEFLALIYKGLGNAFDKRGEKERSVEYYQMALKNNPEENIVRFYIAYQYDYFLKKPVEAINFYREFLSNEDTAISADTIPEPQSEEKNINPDEPEITFSFTKFANDRIVMLTNSTRKKRNVEKK